MYMPERGSDELNQTVEGRRDMVVSDLAVTESVSALTRLVRQGTITSEIARRVQHAILERLDGGEYQRVELTRDIHRRAEQFLLTLTSLPLRAADALHLALANEARAASMAVFDSRLTAAARSIGLAVYPP